jgi:hypothetical protein
MFLTRESHHADDINRMLFNKTGFEHYICDKDADFWSVNLKTVGYEIHPDFLSRDMSIHRLDTQRHIYGDVNEGFRDLNKDAADLGFEIHRISGQKLIIRDLTGKWYNLELAYEKDEDGLNGEVSYNPCNCIITSVNEYPILQPECDIRYGPNSTPMSRAVRKACDDARIANKWAYPRA